MQPVPSVPPFYSSSSSSSYLEAYCTARLIEEKILKSSGLVPKKDIEILAIPIDFGGQNYIHTYRCGKNNKKTIVLLHGYASSSILFFPILKDLASKFQVLCVDLLGMGLSSRPNFECKTAEETIEYFVESLEKWREAMGLKEFYLGGHAMGAYMGVNYALKYQKHVRKLLLISPAGITMEQNAKETIEWVENLPWSQRKIYETVIKLWEEEATPTEVFKKYSVIGRFFLKQYLKKQYSETIGGESIPDLLYDMFEAGLKMPPGSEKSLHNLFGPPIAIVHAPLENKMLEGLNIQTIFFFGEKDLNDCHGPHRLSTNGQKSNFILSYVKDAGNQIFIDNPKELVKQIQEVIDN